MSGEPSEDGEVNEMRNRIRYSSPSGLHDLRFYKQAALTSSPPPLPFSGGGTVFIKTVPALTGLYGYTAIINIFTLTVRDSSWSALTSFTGTNKYSC